MEKIGKAYGFFSCYASKEEIESYLPSIRDSVETPSELELSLIEGVDNLEDKELAAFAQDAKQRGMNYVLQAYLPNKTNKDTANEVSGILNQAYQSPLYENAEFKGAIVYEESGDYIFRD